MDLSHLQLFRDVVKARSISRGAEQNGVSQSAASQAVQELERSLNARLLDRSRRPLEVLPSGQLLYEFAREVLRRRDELLVRLGEMRGGQNGKVRVAAIYSIGLTEMARLEEEFRRLLPEAHLEVDYLRPEKVYEAVAEERADLGLVSYPESTREVVALPWRQEPMVVACAPGHALASLGRVRPEDLENTEFIGFDHDLPISRAIQQFLKERGVHVHVVLHFDNIQSMKEALRHERAVSILPEPILREEAAEGRLAAVALDAPLYRPLGIIHRRRKVFSRAGEVFLELLRKRAREAG